MEAQKNLHRIVYLLPGKSILDIGCASAPIWEHADTVDYNPDTKPTYCCDASDLSEIADETYDIVHSSHCLEDIEDTEKALLEWKRVLKPGGYLIIYCPDKRWYPNIGEKYANAAHKHDFIKEDIIPILESMGMFIELAVDCPPPDGKYDYENRANIEYSFLIIARRF